MRCTALCQPRSGCPHPAFTRTPPCSPKTFCSSVFIVCVETPPVRTGEGPSSQRSAGFATVTAHVLRLLLAARVRRGTGRVLSPLGSCQRCTRSPPGTWIRWLKKDFSECALGDNYAHLQKYEYCRAKVGKYMFGNSPVSLSGPLPH